MASHAAPIDGARAVAPGLWRWTAWHPEWEQEVGCVVLERDGALVLIDPMITDDGWRSLDRAVERAASLAVVLTVHFHDRSAGAALERWPRAELWAERESVAEVTAAVSRPFRVGEPLPGGLESLATPRPGEVVLWDPATGSLIPGDVLLGSDEGLTLSPASWLPDGVGLEDLARSLRPALALPIERVLVSHGEPILSGGRAALARALDA